MKDFDRELSHRGIEDAKHIAKMMRARDFLPSRIACSPSRRTRMTLDGILPAWQGPEPEINFDASLYHGDSDDYLAAIRGFAGAASGMVIGHNPNCEIIASLLCGGGEPGAIATMNQKYPTGALAVFDLAIDDWSRVKPGSGHLAAFVIPKEL
jgi:phosphohistidine phosphatase